MPRRTEAAPHLPPRRHRLHARAVACVSYPLLLLILALCWFALWTSRGHRPPLHAMHIGDPGDASSWSDLRRLARAVLERWPYFVAAILGIGAAVGLLLGGPSGVWWGLGAAVVGAGLTPALAEHVPPSWFDGSRRP
jgi:hypothetical protein